MRTRSWAAALAACSLLLQPLIPARPAAAATQIQVILNGKPLALEWPVEVVNQRTLMPARALLEKMGAELGWDNATRIIEITRESDQKYIRIQIDRRLACLNQACTDAASLDVPAQLIGPNTYIPVRFVSQAMGAHVSWDQARQAVIIDTTKPPEVFAPPVALPTITRGQTISEPLKLRADAVPGGKHVQFYLVDPATGSGPMIGAGDDVTAEYSFTPDPTIQGTRLVVAGVRYEDGSWRYSDPVPVQMAPRPKVEVTKIDYDGLVDGPIYIGSAVNFVATHTELRTVDVFGNKTALGEVGPNDGLTWYPQITQNGNQWVQAIAYDRNGTAYESEPIRVRVNSDYRTVFTGLTDGATLTRSPSLKVATNYPVHSIKYVLDGQVLGWGYNYAWNLSPELNGPHTLSVEVMDSMGTVRTLGPYNFTVKITPTAWFTGVGPNQVVTGPVTLKAASNVPVDTVEYYLIEGFNSTKIGSGESVTWTPTKAGDFSIQMTARDTATGKTLWSDPVKFRVFLGTVYGPKPIVPQPEFKDLMSSLAVPVYRETGMSAALQVAQSILETGWGQASPVDKYTGQVSYNLFGIKGTGPAGLVISNTWEVYNGVSYRVDDYFRAYNNIEESFRDHADFLLLRERYAPVRRVMTSPVQGAWELKRAGYATDPRYPHKLIDIMKRYELFKLDEVTF